MSDYKNLPESQADNISHGMSEIGQKATKETMKKIAKKLAKKAIIKGSLAFKKLLLALLPIILKFLLIFLLIFFVILGFYVILERGETLLYSPEHENTVQDGVITELSDENAYIMLFYKYHAINSLYRIHEDKPNVINNNLRDYYEREEMFILNYNLLYSLDEVVFERKVRYPEQFIKPVPYDKNNLTMLRYYDAEQQEILIKSKNPITNKKEIGLWDYGLAPVLVYKTDEINRKIEGKYVKEDYFCEVDKKVKQREIEIEFSEQVKGYPEKIDIISRALTAVGQYDFKYLQNRVIVGNLKEEIGEIHEPVTKIKYGEYREYKDVPIYKTVKVPIYEKRPITKEECEQIPIYETRLEPIYQTVPIYDTICIDFGYTTYCQRVVIGYEKAIIGYEKKEVIIGYNKICETIIIGYEDILVGYEEKEEIVGYEKELVQIHNLYRYRDGYVFEYRPILDEVEHQIENNYIITYLNNFKTFLPEGVLEDFNFENRLQDPEIKKAIEAIKKQQKIDYSSILQQGEDYNKFLADAFGYLNEVIDLSKAFGITDEYIVLAMIAHHKEINKDLMNLRNHIGKTVVAMDYSSNKQVSIKITEDVINNHKENIKAGIMLFQSLLNQNIINHDYIKALYAYNHGINKLKEIDEEYLKTEEWLLHKEGNYIESVMKYYRGDNKYSNENLSYFQLSLKENLWERTINFFKNASSNLFATNYNFEKMTKFERKIDEDEIKTILAMSKSLDNQTSILASADDIILESLNENYEFIFAINQQITTNTSFMQNIILLGQIANLEGYIAPLTGGFSITSPFGYRIHPISGQNSFHRGIDLGAKVGTPVLAINDGVVIGSSNRDLDARGKYVNIRHDDGNVSRYYHLHDVYVKDGERVEKGLVIGTVGNTGASTGPHLHFEFIINGQHVDPYPIFFNRP